LKLHLIGLRNLIVEVDAKYIKGMLAHPDLVPSASINRWIISILTFHFELVHVPSAFHGPDGLSRQHPQPGDKPEPEDDFDDWIDRLHGFMHMIAPYFLHRLNLPPIAIYIAETNETTFDPAPTSDSTPNIPQDTPSEDSTTPYSIVPRSPLAQKADERLLLVRQWHETLQRPPDMSDSEYTTFIRYCTEFFIHSERLWRKNSQGEHKIVVPTENGSQYCWDTSFRVHVRVPCI
jgi:hypothetical protein